jgi:hypothetical protein
MSNDGKESKEKEPKVITYYVNGEEQTTTEHKLTVETILSNAGFTPVADYELQRDNGEKILEPKKEIPIHSGERFTALFKGTTPVS